MKKIATVILSAMLAFGAVFSFAACGGNNEQPEKKLEVEDGVFNRTCTFGMDLSIESKQSTDLTDVDEDNLLAAWVLFVMKATYGEIFDTVVSTTKPSDLYSERNIYFLDDGTCMIQSVSSKLVRDYTMNNIDKFYPGKTEAEAVAELDNGEVKIGGYRIEETEEENKYVIRTSLEDIPELNYDFAAEKFVGKGKFEQEEYGAVKTKKLPKYTPATYDYAAIPTNDVTEKKYLANGNFEVSSEVYREKKVGSNVFQHKVWYPAELETSDKKYPLVVMANGTGATFNTYCYVFEHLASRGFIVVGNDNSWAGFGDASESSLKLMLALNDDRNSKFYGKIDTENIGSAGHSQGGAGAVNAVVAQPHGNMYKAVYSASNTSVDDFWSYDPTKINASFFAVTAENDSLATMKFLQDIYDKIDDGVTKIVARRLNSDHGNMLTYGDGYMTAWFLWQLTGDETAKTDLLTITSNNAWTDVRNNF